MLTKERVLGTSWSYHRKQEYQDLHARFEVLEVAHDDKLGIYIYSRDKGLDMSELESLTLQSLEGLVQRNWIKELTDTDEPASDEDSRAFSMLTFAGAMILFWGFGLWTFVAGIRGPHQQSWEAGIGAAFMIAALLAVAVRRR